jgi:uncharacterized membrane protein SpoIIM required for sporulation
MISSYWLAKRKDHWDRLDLLLAQSKKHGLKSLTRSELQEMGLLYRQAAADLSTLREDPSGKSYARFLNLLLARAHNTIYSGQKSSARGFFDFFLHEYPRVFRRNLNLITIATLLFTAGGLAGMLLTLTRPGFMYLYLGPGMLDTIEHHKMWTDSVVSIKPMAASWIMTNNISVCFFAFVSGIVAGLGSIYSMVQNGVMMGVIGVACWLHGMSLSLWSFVAPHGVLELPAIFISGAAGLRLGQGILFPGLLSRRDSVAKAGAEAIRLVLGIVPVLMIAGTIEGFISPSGLAPTLKFALAGAIAVVFFGYLFSGGKQEQTA